RNIVLQRTQRGKIEMAISFEGDLAIDDVVFDKGLIRKYFLQLQEIVSEFGVGPEQILHEILKLPDVLKTGNNSEIDENLWKAILEATHRAIDHLVIFREHDGRSQFTDLLQSVTSIRDMSPQIDPHDQERLAYVRNR